jgi:hypothetical protein
MAHQAAAGLLPAYQAPSSPSTTIPPRPADIDLTNSGLGESEPTVVAHSANNIDYTTSTFMRWHSDPQNPGSGWHHIHAATYTVFPTYWYTMATELPVLTGYPSAADPWLAIDQTSGTRRNRLYNVGSLFQNDTRYTLTTSIACWTSSNHGTTWSSPVFVYNEPDPVHYFNDKPAVTVSPFDGSVYVARVHLNRYDCLDRQVKIARSVDGGTSWSVPVSVTSTGLTGGPQVVVSPATGYVYVVWTTFALRYPDAYCQTCSQCSDKIQMARSIDNGLTWAAPETVAVPTYGFPQGESNNGIRLYTLASARFNFVKNAVVIVWNEWDAAGTTDVFYRAKIGGSWSFVSRVNDSSVNDQFMPAIDFDSSGNNYVTFYDRRDDPSNVLYQLSEATLDINGNLLRSNYYITTFPTSPYTAFNSFIGDYQQLWCGSWVNTPTLRRIGAFIGIPSQPPPAYNDAWLALDYYP